MTITILNDLLDTIRTQAPHSPRLILKARPGVARNCMQAALARLLGMNKIAALAKGTLPQGWSARKPLSKLAKARLNAAAAG